ALAPSAGAARPSTPRLAHHGRGDKQVRLPGSPPLQLPPMSCSPAPAPALGQSLTSRQLVMMGLGSAIGAGLFLGSGAGIGMAGPAVVLSYLIAGSLVIIVMHAIGEMAAAKPASGAFSVYAADALGPTAGATIGWLWWVQ